MSCAVSPTTKSVQQSTLFNYSVLGTDKDYFYRRNNGTDEYATFAMTDHVCYLDEINSGSLVGFVLSSTDGSTGVNTYTATIRAKEVPNVYYDWYHCHDLNVDTRSRDSDTAQVKCTVTVVGGQGGGGGG